MINSAVVKLIIFDCDGVLVDTETLANQILYQKLIGKGMPISEKEMTQLFLGLTGLLPLFENNLFSATQVANGKPAPDLFLLAADHFAVKPEHCLVIEDSLTGCRAAQTAGMQLLVYNRSASATYPDVICNLQALLGILS